MSWEEIIKGKKLPYTKPSLRDIDRKIERDKQKVLTGMKVVDMTAENLKGIKNKHIFFEELHKMVVDAFFASKRFHGKYKNKIKNPEVVEEVSKLLKEAERLLSDELEL